MRTGKITCVLLGNGSLLTQCAHSLLERGHQISAVVTTDNSISKWATDRGLPCFVTDDVIKTGLPDQEYDWFFSIANQRILPSKVWERARQGTANFHDGPLPRHAGLYAPAWALLAGDSDYGVTWHALSDQIDQGLIYCQHLFEIADNETSLTLNMKCFEAGLASFTNLIAEIEAGTLVGTPQDMSLRSYHDAHDRPPLGATLDFSKSTGEVSRLARALHFGKGYWNPLCMPKLRTNRGAYNVVALAPVASPSSAPAGTVVSVDHSSAVIATADGAVRIGGLSDSSGAPIQIDSVVNAGEMLPLAHGDDQGLDALLAEAVPHEIFFRQRLREFRDLELYGVDTGSENTLPQWLGHDLPLPNGMKGERALAGLIAGLARLSERDRVDAYFTDDTLAARAKQHPGYIADSVPLSVRFSEHATAASLTETVAGELRELRRRVGHLADLASRRANSNVLNSIVAIALVDAPETVSPRVHSAVTFVLPRSGSAARILYDSRRLKSEDAAALAKHLSIAMTVFAADERAEIASLPLISQDGLSELLYTRNATDRAYDRSALVHSLFEHQVEKTPDATALICGDQSLTYRELDSKANRVRDYLISLGVGPETLVGLQLTRSCDLIVGALAILKAGGAYVPLDPTYPSDRITFMIEDSCLTTLIVEASALPAFSMPRVRAISIAEAMTASPEAAPPPQTSPNNLAYVIYTSGSTGRPKGVMIEHRNVINFFAGMDERIPVPESGQPVWLAVTSLSFDISVLELFWTLARGFKVVIQKDKNYHRDDKASPVSPPGIIDFGLFYWGDDDGTSPRKYQLLLEGARFAEKHGFTAVWTPERHFHAFGGPYPNPAVTGAAVAAITKNLSIRAGSCVLPLHHPARVVEEWAVIDNLSDGRAAIAFASGWMPEDFLLRPENAPPANKTAMFRDIEVVRKLWRGEDVAFPTPDGGSINIVTQPRPLQKELPIWITTAGNPETFREAARVGANVLTHLLGQSISEVAEKVAIYRDELRKVGRDPAQYKVTMMLHTLVGRDRETVREQARAPMKRYLRSAAALIKQYAWAFPAFKRPKNLSSPANIDLRTLTDEEMDAILDFAFLRYFDDSGLFGTVEDAVARVDQLKAIGIDEIACLIDFGVPYDVAYEALTPLAEVVRATKARPILDAPRAMVADTTEPDRAGALIRKHGVTHLQCTPAMASMLLEDRDDAAALAELRHMFIGGEALQGSLLRQLRSATHATIENMYGPTETTIWSSTGPAHDTDGNVPLGTPIANTQLYVLDNKQQPVPPGLPGELLIGGDGVARGYLNRAELTAERFIPNPFVTGGRMYRTGDLVRIGADSELHFMGRNDHQVKVRGHRIELGEIENRIGTHPGVNQAIVIAREDTPGDVRIVAYMRFDSQPVPDESLRAHVRQALPEFMVPAHFVALEQFPLTPNLKVDRKLLPPPGTSVATSAAPYEAPASDLEKQIAEVFKSVLGIDKIGLNDNFFDLGGHSLLAVQVHRDLKAGVAPAMSITDLYRFPTIAGLVGHLRNANSGKQHLDKVAARAAERRAALSGRRAAPARLGQ